MLIVIKIFYIFLFLINYSVAQEFPARVIRFIVPYTPGGDTDFVARSISPKLSESLKQQVIVDNRPGAGSLIGMEAMLRAPADGYTLAMGTISSLAVLPVTKSSVSYDPIKDISPVILLTVAPYVLHVHPSLPVHSVSDLVRLAKLKVGQLSYGTPGIATGLHLTGEYFSFVAGIKLVHIPYKGSSPLMAEFTSGNISLAFLTLSTTKPFIQNRKLRPLAIAANIRSKEFAYIPLMSESGYPGFEASTWHGMVARTNTPKQIITRLNFEINRILNNDEISLNFKNIGFDIGAGSSDDFQKFIISEITKWKKVSIISKIKLD